MEKGIPLVTVVLRTPCMRALGTETLDDCPRDSAETLAWWPAKQKMNSTLFSVELPQFVLDSETIVSTQAIAFAAPLQPLCRKFKTRLATQEADQTTQTLCYDLVLTSADLSRPLFEGSYLRSPSFL
jgi:hypothetical protein